MRLARLLAVSLLLSLGYLVTSGGMLVAQEPTPAPTATPHPACGNVIFEGPGQRTLYEVTVQVPAGSYGMTIPPPGADPLFVLCHVPTGAVLTISGVDCREIARQAPNAAAEAVIDQIVSSCEPAPPTPAPSTPPLSIPGFCRAGESIRGGQTVTIDRAISITLPPGNFVITLDDFGMASVCNPDVGYWLILHLGDCSRRDIRPPPPFDVHGEVTSQIEASCVVLDTGRVFPTPHPPVPTGGITPPSTGDAGIR